MTAAAPRRSPTLRVLQAIFVAVALAAIGGMLFAMVKRLVYPYDLEWMEGGSLTHALRIQQRLPTYAPPTVDFVPFLYTPFYPLIVSVFGPSYFAARLVSIVSFLGACGLTYGFARREGGSRVAALGALAIPCAAYASTGVWYDLARADSLFLLLVTIAAMIAYSLRDSAAGAVAAAMILVLAFFTKQTASPFMVAIGLYWLLVNWRMALLFGATLAVVGLPLLYAFDRSTEGWFWTYVFKLHQQHDFHPVRAFLGTPARLILLLGPALLLLPLGLLRARTRGLWFALYMAGVGIAVACVGFGTQWAWHNAFIPGIFFPAMAIATMVGRLEASPRWQAVGFVALIAAVGLAPGALLKPASAHTPHEWGIHADAPTGYNLLPYVPTAADREKGDQLIAKLRTTPGDVLIPFHPFYAHLAGKPCFLHRMGTLDVSRAGLGYPKGLGESFTKKRWAVVVIDDKIEGTWHTFPGLQQNYKSIEALRGPPTFAGAITTPRYWMIPK